MIRRALVWPLAILGVFGLAMAFGVMVLCHWLTQEAS